MDTKGYHKRECLGAKTHFLVEQPKNVVQLQFCGFI